MDPLIEHQDLRPPPQPGPPGGLLVAILIHALLIGAVVWGIQWQFSSTGVGAREQAKHKEPERTVSASVFSRTQPSQPSAAGKETTPAIAQSRPACPLRPLLAAASARDGQLVPPPNVSGALDKDIDALLVSGKEAAAAGRVRDAEVAFLSSCRVADARKGPGSIESANARYQLARHYVEVAAAAKLPAAQRTEMLGKAQAFYEESLQRFRTQFGDSHEKTRFAAQGLEAARVALRLDPGAAHESSVTTTAGMGAGPAPSAPVEERPTATERARPAAQSPEVGRPLSAVAPSSTPRGGPVRPSFDCRKARSYAERTICSDPQLAQLDQDLSRLYARARLGAADPEGFRWQNDVEWRRRERTCRDRNCLVRWYNDRRQQLTFYLPAAERAR